MKKCPQCGRDIPEGMNNCQGCGYNGQSYDNKSGGNNQTSKIVLIIVGGLVLLGLIGAGVYMAVVKFAFNQAGNIIDQAGDIIDQAGDMTNDMIDQSQDIINQGGQNQDSTIGTAADDIVNDMLDRFEQNKNDKLEQFEQNKNEVPDNITLDECKNKCDEEYMYVNGLCTCTNFGF